jgi:hypothetical protein
MPRDVTFEKSAVVGPKVACSSRRDASRLNVSMGAAAGFVPVSVGGVEGGVLSGGVCDAGVVGAADELASEPPPPPPHAVRNTATLDSQRSFACKDGIALIVVVVIVAADLVQHSLMHATIGAEGAAMQNARHTTHAMSPATTRSHSRATSCCDRRKQAPARTSDSAQALP